MKFLVEKLYLAMSRAKQLKKKKRSTNHGVATMEIGATVAEKRMESSIPMSPTITAPTVTSFIRVASVSLDLEVMVSNPPIEGGVGPDMEMMTGD